MNDKYKSLNLEPIPEEKPIEYSPIPKEKSRL